MIVIGIGEYAITKDIDETIVTHALGSCVAIMFRCPTTKLTAMAHVVLPEQAIHVSKDRTETYRPAYFADEVLPKMFNAFISYPGCKLEEVDITIVGGAEAMNIDDIFQVGKRNLDKIKQILQMYKARFRSHETGGRFSRTVEIIVKTGEIRIKKQPMIL